MGEEKQMEMRVKGRVEGEAAILNRGGKISQRQQFKATKGFVVVK